MWTCNVIFRERVAADGVCNDFCYNGGTYTGDGDPWEYNACDCLPGTTGGCCETVCK